ncbi:MAG: hypothetical protein HC831_15715 [Chloroflexia bacterium]|nr:hypothetical protein [Chloroflexia bacterium]
MEKIDEIVIYNQKILEANNYIQAICNEFSAYYIDLHSQFVLNGSLNPMYDSGDHLHINKSGYKKWSEIISPFIYDK